MTDDDLIALWDQHAAAPHAAHPAVHFGRAVLAASKEAATKGAEAQPNIPGLAADPSAFVRWAEPAGYDITCHPLHFLFLNERTYAARQGWNACRQHYGIDNAPATPAPAAPQPDYWRSTVGAMARALDQCAAHAPESLLPATMREAAARLNLLLVTSTPAAPQDHFPGAGNMVAAPPAQAPAPAAGDIDAAHEAWWRAANYDDCDTIAAFKAGAEWQAARTQAPAVAPQEPLTDGDHLRMWQAAVGDLRAAHRFDWYCRGIKDAEAAHGIRLSDGGGA